MERGGGAEVTLTTTYLYMYKARPQVGSNYICDKVQQFIAICLQTICGTDLLMKNCDELCNFNQTKIYELCP